MKLNPERVLRLINEMDPRVNKEEISLNYPAYLELKNYATEALHFEIANRKGGKREETRRRVALAYLKRHSGGIGPKYVSHSWIEDGYQIFTDGRSAYRFAEGHYIDGLPQISPEEHRVPDTDQFFRQVADTTSEAEVNQKDLEIAISTWKAEGKPDKLLWYPVGASYYNGEFLLEALKLLGTDKATVKQRELELVSYGTEERRTSYRYHPGHIVLEGREAVIMPLEQPEGEKNKEELQ
jgi:hypothetical protein